MSRLWEIRAAISKLALDVVSFSFSLRSQQHVPFIRSLCLRWTGNGNIVEISNPLSNSPPHQFVENLPAKSVRRQTSFFFPFLFSLSLVPFPLRLKFSHVPPEKLLYSITVIFFLKKSWRRVLELMIRKIEEFKGFFFYFYGLIFHHIYKLYTEFHLPRIILPSFQNE